jgi:hypothetical protein
VHFAAWWTHYLDSVSTAGPRSTKEGLPEKEIIRCLKRYVAREVYRQLRGSA